MSVFSGGWIEQRFAIDNKNAVYAGNKIYPMAVHYASADNLNF